MLIRLARPDEVELLHEIEASAASLFTDSSQPFVAVAPVTPAEAYLPLIAQGAVAVAVQDDELVGFCAYEPIDGELHLHELSVRREHQRRGVGKALLEWTADRAKALGLPAVTLTTFVSIPWNASYYERLGFTTLPRGFETIGVRAVLERQAALGLDMTDRCVMRREV